MQTIKFTEYSQNLSKALDLYRKNCESLTSTIELASNNLSSALDSMRDVLMNYHFNINLTAERMDKLFKTIDWSTIEEYALARKEIDGEIEAPAPMLTPEIEQALGDDIREIFSEPQNWEQKAQAKVSVWQREHPVLAVILFRIIFALVMGLLTTYLYSATVQKTAHLYEEPTASSEIIMDVVPDQDIVIIGDAPYYYEIEITDSETGETYVGYIYKAAIEFCGSFNDIDDSEEEGN